MVSHKASTARILAHLQAGHTLTVATAGTLFEITSDSVRARITELRKAGYSIYSNPTTGRAVTYRLGRPTRREIVAGKLVLSDPYFARLLGPRIDRNLSLA